MSMCFGSGSGLKPLRLKVSSDRLGKHRDRTDKTMVSKNIFKNFSFKMISYRIVHGCFCTIEFIKKKLKNRQNNVSKVTTTRACCQDTFSFEKSPFIAEPTLCLLDVVC